MFLRALAVAHDWVVTVGDVAISAPSLARPWASFSDETNGPALLVPNDVKSSYLMLMLQDFPPEDATPPGVEPPPRAGYMPMSNATLCCQKLAAIERWINAGAPSN